MIYLICEADGATGKKLVEKLADMDQMIKVILQTMIFGMNGKGKCQLSIIQRKRLLDKEK